MMDECSARKMAFEAKNMTSSPDERENDFGRLFVQHQVRIYGLIHSMVMQDADAEDVFQETASVLWRKSAEFEPGSNFAAWALSVARFQVQKFYLQKKRGSRQMSEAFWEAVTADAVTESAWQGDLQTMLSRCLTLLSPAHRQLFTKYYQSPGNPKKLAAELNRPLTSIYTAVNRIRRVLAECVERAMSREARP
jgi:RNA polymerase sigma-70 factor, ECF subfamily